MAGLAPVRFGSVTVRAQDGSSGSGFSAPTVPLWKGILCFSTALAEIVGEKNQ